MHNHVLVVVVDAERGDRRQRLVEEREKAAHMYAQTADKIDREQILTEAYTLQRP